MAVTLTPQAMAQQWAGAGSRLEVNLFNFGTLAGEAARSVFLKSFELHRFNSAGAAPWPAHKRRPTVPHDLLDETGALKDSIKFKTGGLEAGMYGATVYTDPSEFKREARNKDGKCFAAIHNEGGRDTAKPGSPASYIPERRFIGHSTILKDKLDSLVANIFDGLPK